MATFSGLAAPTSNSRRRSRLLVHWVAMKSPTWKFFGLVPVSAISEVLTELLVFTSLSSRPQVELKSQFQAPALPFAPPVKATSSSLIAMIGVKPCG